MVYCSQSLSEPTSLTTQKVEFEIHLTSIFITHAWSDIKGSTLHETLQRQREPLPLPLISSRVHHSIGRISRSTGNLMSLNLKSLSPLRRAWYKWKAIKFPWRNKLLVGKNRDLRITHPPWPLLSRSRRKYRRSIFYALGSLGDPQAKRSFINKSFTFSNF